MHEQRFQIFVVAQSNRTIALELPLRAQTRLVDLVALVAARSAIEGAHRRENKSKRTICKGAVCLNFFIVALICFRRRIALAVRRQAVVVARRCERVADAGRVQRAERRNAAPRVALAGRRWRVSMRERTN